MIALKINDLRQLTLIAQIAGLLVCASTSWSVAQEAAPAAGGAVSPASGAANGPRVGSAQSPLPALRQALPAGGANQGREVLPISGKILRYAQKLVDHYDANDNGSLDSEEWGQMAGTPRLADLNGDGVLTVEELAERVASYSQQRSLRLMPTPLVERGAGGAPQPGGPGSPSAMAGSNGVQTQLPAKQFYVPSDQLPTGLAEWFVTKDRDGDGQVTMAEFAEKWTQIETAEFARYDANGDGVITSGECARGHLQRQAEEAAAQQAAEAALPPGAVRATVSGRTGQ